MNKARISDCNELADMVKRLWTAVAKMRLGILLLLIAALGCKAHAPPQAAIPQSEPANDVAVSKEVFSKWPVPQGNINWFFATSSEEKLMALIRNNPSLMEERDNYQYTALHYAAIYGRLNEVKWLLEHKADVNAVADNNFTPMHVVTNAAVATLLIKAGADLTKRDSWNKTPLQGAAQKGNTNVCEAILASGFPIDFASAIWLRKRDLAMQMLKAHPELAKQSDEGPDLWENTSPLGIAAAIDDKEMVALLLKAGAPVNSFTYMPNQGDMTPLCNAVWAGHYDIAEMLCKAGADCNVSGGPAETLVDFAVRHSSKEMIALLVKYGGKRSGPERDAMHYLGE